MEGFVRVKFWLVMAVLTALAAACGSEQAPSAPVLNDISTVLVADDGKAVPPEPRATASPDSTPISPEETELIDALGYAERNDVDLAEARRRLGQTSDISELQRILRQDEIFTFGGLFIEKEPRYRVVVLFTRDGEEIIRPYVEGGALEGVIEVRTVAATENDLKIAQRKATQFAEALGLGALGIDFHTSTDIRNNQVKLIVPDPDMLHARVNEMSLAIPDNVVVVEGVVTPAG